jgi:hypothetical protein
MRACNLCLPQYDRIHKNLTQPINTTKKMNQISQYFKGRLTFPKLLTILAVATIPIQAWAFYTLFEDLEVWSQLFNIAELWATWSYAFFYVLLDTLTLTVFILIPLYLLPKKMIRDRFVESAFLNILVISAVTVIIQFNDSLFKHIEIIFLVVVIISFLIAALTSYLPPKVLFILSGIADRMLVLAFLFWVIDGFALITIMIRNLI